MKRAPPPGTKESRGPSISEPRESKTQQITPALPVLHPSPGATSAKKRPPGSKGGEGEGDEDVDIDEIPPEEVDTVLRELAQKTSLIEIGEVATDRVQDRFLEFVSRSIIVRSYDGPGKPGNAMHCIMPSIRLSIVRFKDTGFFHFTEGDHPHLLCHPTTMDPALFRKRLEDTFRLKVADVPQMMSNVRLSLEAMTKVWSYVVKRNIVKDEADAVAASKVKASSTPATHFTLGGTVRSSEDTNLTFFVNEFVLLFSQRQPLVLLHAALDRLQDAIGTYTIGYRYSLARPIADCLLALVDVLSSCDQPTLVEAICEAGVALVVKLRTEDLQGVCHMHSDAMLGHLFHILTRQTYSPKVGKLVAALAGVIPSARMSKRLSTIGEGGTLEGNAEIVSRLNHCCHRCLDSLIPQPSEVGVSLDEIRGIIASTAVRSGEEGLRWKTVTSSASQVTSELKGKSSAAHINASQEDLLVSWNGAISALEASIPALDNIVQVVDESDSTFKKLSRALLRGVVQLVKITVRSLWFIPPETALKLLCTGAAAICSVFRRISVYCAMLNDNTQWVDALQGATALILTRAMLVHLPKAANFHYIHHQWIVKISVGCGTASERSILSEMHYFYCVLSRLKQWESKELIPVWNEVRLVISAVHTTAPSPSQVQTVFSTVLGAVDAFIALSTRKSDMIPRQYLMSLMFSSIVDLSATDFVYRYHIPDATTYLKVAHWENYEEFEADDQNQVSLTHRTIFQGVSAVELLLMAAPLVYVTDLLKDDLQTGRELSYGKDCVTFADQMTKSGVPQSISSLFILSGVHALRSSAFHIEVEHIVSGRFSNLLWQVASFPRAFQLAETMSHQQKAVQARTPLTKSTSSTNLQRGPQTPKRSGSPSPSTSIPSTPINNGGGLEPSGYVKRKSLVLDAIAQAYVLD